MDIRPATAAHAHGMSRVLREIREAERRPATVAPVGVLDRDVHHPRRLACTVCLDDREHVLGFQSLKTAWDGNPYDVATGWGIIGAHIGPRAARRGVVSALFATSLDAARAAGLPSIDATIGAGNRAALAFYDRLGWTYRAFRDCVCKACVVRGDDPAATV